MSETPNISLNDEVQSVSNIEQIIRGFEDLSSDIASGAMDRNDVTEDVVLRKEAEIEVSEKPRRRTLLGRSAILGTKSKDVNDCLVVRDLVVDKYKDRMNHFRGRSFQRRTSRERLRTYDDDSMDDSIQSQSSVGTPDSHSSFLDYNDSPFVFQRCDENRSSTSSLQERYKFIISSSNYEDQKLEDFGEQKFENIDCGDDRASQENSVITTDLDEDLNFSDDEYDQQNFLRRALGAEMDYSSSQISSNMSLHRVIEKNRSTTSLTSLNASSILTRMNSLCGSIRNKIRKKLHSKKFSSRRSSTQSLNSLCSLDLIHENTDISRKEYLESELIKEMSTVLQALKALNYCTSMKEFRSGTEHLEAEKILLLASCRKQAITEEIDKITFKTNEEEIPENKCYGSIQISNITLFSKEPTEISDAEYKKEYVEHFVVVVGCNENLTASEIFDIDGMDERNIQKVFKFEGLQADFLISVSVYSMKVRNPVKNYTHETKFHLDKDTNTCARVLTLQKNSQKKVVDDVSTLKPSSFTLRGRCDIRSTDLSRNGPFKMYNVPKSSTIKGEFRADLKSKVRFDIRKCGFLNIADVDAKGCWSRRWCLLKNCELKYWNYPSEENSASPLGSINLRNCATRYIDVADRSECPKNKTLLLPIIMDGGNVKKYFLSADSLADMEKWQKDFNYVISNLQIWNCR